MGVGKDCGYAECIRYHRVENPDDDSADDSDAYFRAVSFGEYVKSAHAATLRCKGGDVGVGGVKDCSSVGFDQHNLNLTGNKAMTLLNARADGHSVPTVFQRMSDDS